MRIVTYVPPPASASYVTSLDPVTPHPSPLSRHLSFVTSFFVTLFLLPRTRHPSPSPLSSHYSPVTLLQLHFRSSYLFPVIHFSLSFSCYHFPINFLSSLVSHCHSPVITLPSSLSRHPSPVNSLPSSFSLHPSPFIHLPPSLFSYNSPLTFFRHLSPITLLSLGVLPLTSLGP